MSVSVAVGATQDPCRWDKSKAYTKGSVTFFYFLPTEAVSDIPANTDWSWQVASDVGINISAGWRPLINGDLNWRGIYSDANTYAVNDVVAGGANSRLFICNVAITAAGANNNPYSGTARGKWAHFQNSAGYAFMGASATDDGMLGLVPAPVAAKHNAPLMGNGTFGLNVQTPANNAIGKQGNICFDSNYLYVWTGDNSVKRISLSSF